MRVALLGFYAKANFGDDLMAREIPVALRRAGADSVRVYSDGEGGGGQVACGLTDTSWHDADAVIIGGGGLVTPHFWALKDARLEHLYGKKVAFLNVNVTAEMTGDPAFVEKLRRLEARWWVRDQRSVDRLASVGIASTLLPDISFAVTPSRFTDPARTLTVVPNSYVFYDLVGEDARRASRAMVALRELAAFLDWMVNFGWRVQLLPAQTSRDADDRLPCAALFAAMRRREAATWEGVPLPVDALTERIAASSLVLSMRYHATTVALAAGVPVVPILFHDKMRALIEELSLVPTTAVYENLTVPALVGAAQEAENHGKYAPRIATYRAEAHRRWIDTFAEEWAAFVGSPAGGDPVPAPTAPTD